MRYVSFHNLNTSRLCLRKITPDDRESYFRLFSSPEVAKYMLWEPHTSIAQTDAALEKLMARYSGGKCYRWGITLRGLDSLIGIIELLHFDEAAGNCGFAYQISPEYWGKGYGTEALTAALDFAFSEMGMDTVEADHMGHNVASGAVMKKAGMTYVGTMPGKYTKNGVSFDAPQYRITREEWKMR